MTEGKEAPLDRTQLGFRVPRPSSRILEIYEVHPLSAESILERACANKGAGDLDELDLAIDEETEITDQNHIGGIECVTEIARRVGLHSGCKVFDVGSGLGGPARALAYFLGCRVLGIELTPFRYAGSVELTRAVGLQGLANFCHADFLTDELPNDQFDLVLGLSSFVHFPDKKRAAQLSAGLLRPGGWIALEDVCLKRLPKSRARQGVLRELTDLWHAHWATADQWMANLEATSFSIQESEDMTAQCYSHFERLLAAAARHPTLYARSEVASWRHAVDLVGAGVLSYMRILATTPGD